MANHLAIAAVARTVLELIKAHCPRDEFAGEPSFLLYQSHDFGKELVNEGFSLMLYRVTVNTAARNHPARRGPDGLKRRPALPLDLHFLLTPWAGEAERQLRLLGWAMRFIEDHTILPAALLNQSLSRRERPAFNDDEAVELICDPPGLADYLGLWDKYKARWQTPVTYAARMVLIESDVTQRDEALVRTRDLQSGTEAPEALR
jgi:hypothetical protein